MRCSTDSPMPSSTPQHSSMPCSRTSWQVSKRSSQVWVVTISREERPGRLEVVVVAVHAALGQALGLLVGEDAGADTATLRPVSLAHDRHELEQPLHGALVGAAHGEHDAELAERRASAVSAAPRRAPRRCRGTAWP